MNAPELPRKIFVVVDPAQDQLLAFDRAIITAEKYSARKLDHKPYLNVLVAVDTDNNDTSAENAKMFRSIDWFREQLLKPLDNSGWDYDINISWSTDWYDAILQEIKRVDPDIIMLPLAQRPSTRERLFNESIWKLLRTANKPVLVTQPGDHFERKTILAAVNFQSHKEEYQRLNEIIIARGQWLAAAYDADLHIVNAYEDSLHYPDRSQLASRTAVDPAKIHVRAGAPADVIPTVAGEINADIVVLGIRSRYNRWRGNTLEKIITKVECDILAIN